MKKLIAAISLVITAGLFSLPACAETLQLVSVGGQSAGGEDVLPYNMSINGSSTLTPMMCLDLNRSITFGEKWSVTGSGIPTGNSTTDIDYRAVALIFYAAENGLFNISLADYQYAAWSIFDPAATSNSAFTATAATIATDAVQFATTGGFGSIPGFSNFSYSNFTIFSPTSDQTGWTAGLPQEFIGQVSPTPEPSSLLLLGTGIVGTAGMIRRKLQQQA